MNRVKEIREGLGLRQQDVAEKLNTHKSVISRYERGELDLNTGAINALCDLFGCTADHLLGRSQAPQVVLTDRQIRLLAAYDGADPRDRDFIDHLLRLDVPEEKKKAV